MIGSGTDVFTIVAPGEPVAMGRPRFSRNGHTYTPEKSRMAVRTLAALLRLSGGKKRFPVGAVSLQIRFVMGIPKSQQARIDGTPCTKRPDTDNLVKLVCDSATEAGVWSDDSQVTSIAASKEWGFEPRTEITIRAIVAE